jgi:hypothetical protein
MRVGGGLLRIALWDRSHTETFVSTVVCVPEGEPRSRLAAAGCTIAAVAYVAASVLVLLLAVRWALVAITGD